MTEWLIVIGGCAAGMSAASKARRLNPDLEIPVPQQWVLFVVSGGVIFPA